MGLDVGDVRTGIALSDPLRMISSPHSVLDVSSPEGDAAAIAGIVREKEVAEIVVGLPLDQNGEVGPQAEKVLGFVEVLKEHVDVPVTTLDERFSTKSAERALIEADVSRKGRKKVVDKVAAQLILQQHLDRRAHQRKRDS